MHAFTSYQCRQDPEYLYIFLVLKSINKSDFVLDFVNNLYGPEDKSDWDEILSKWLRIQMKRIQYIYLGQNRTEQIEALNATYVEETIQVSEENNKEP